MKFVQKGIALVLAAALCMPAIPVYGNEKSAKDHTVTDEITFNTGTESYTVVTSDMLNDMEKNEEEPVQYVSFDEAGNYEIQLEDNAFFPYEIQFSYDGKISTEWFMTPDDTKEIDGHLFSVVSASDGSVITQMSLNVAGEEVIVYPQEKNFESGKSTIKSLLPLETRYLDVDLSDFTPLDLTNVSVKKIFAGENAIKDTDKVMWAYLDKDYKISQSGKLDLSLGTYFSENTGWDMIVGEADQLAASNVKYRVSVRHARTQNWLNASAVIKNEKGKEEKAEYTGASYYDYEVSNRHVQINYSAAEYSQKVKIGLKQNGSVFSIGKGSSVKVYEGKYTSASSAKKGKDITAKIWDHTNYEVQTYKDQWVTFVSFNEKGTATGCLPLLLRVYYTKDGLSYPSLFKKTANGREYVQQTGKITTDENTSKMTSVLYKEYPVNGTYAVELDYVEKGEESNSSVTAAYVGQYKSIAAAKKAKAKDVTKQLFSSDYNNGGYEANYSKGVWFSVFVGKDKDKNQKVYNYFVKTEKGTQSQGTSGPNSSSNCNFYGVTNGSDSNVPYYRMDADSFAENNFLTFFVNSETDLSHLALNFSLVQGAKLYAAGSNTPEISGKSFHDFSNGAVQFTVSAEDGHHAGSYWIQVINAQSEEGKLYVNSLSDVNAKTKEKDGVIYTTREMTLDSFHDNAHDIMLANIGKNAIDKLSVSLKSSVLDLDKYWTLKGKYGLDGLSDFTGGELSDLAMVRLKAKSGVKAGTNASGTLTFKSGNKTLMVMTLTGTIGNPTITTKKIPKAVKYVPYGSMIQNSNKYSWNEVTYKLISGKLPKGMKLKANGEIYGVPKETGKFTFTVQMNNSYRSFASTTKKFTLNVVKNTDKNVNAATDKGYNLSKRIEDINPNAANEKSYLMVSEGIFEDFVDVYLDGKKLVKGKDYDAESGSTRITIATQTLTKNKKTGSHTLGVEFRTQKNKELKRAAQNYKITTKKSDTTKKPDTTKKSDTTKKPDTTKKSDTTKKPDMTKKSDTTKKPDATEKPDTTKKPDITKKPDTIQAPNVNAGTGTYSIHKGDTLWRIAVKKYGDGSKWTVIYEANKDKIQSPRKLKIGQRITLP